MTHDREVAEIRNDLKMVQVVVDLLVSSQSLQDLCRRFVHENYTSGLILGAHVYSITTALDIVLEIGYGMTTNSVRPVSSTWDKDCLMARSVKDKTAVFVRGNDYSHLALPLIRANAPMAILLLVIDSGCQENPISSVTFEIFSKIGALFVESKPTRDNQPTNRKSISTLAELTPRQITILSLASKGLTNSAIGKQVSLSESSVRQETIRIYRALDANGRLEAVAKARLGGLIPA